jgi:hypothetical protein
MSVKKLAVADANAANLIVLHDQEMGCCSESVNTCKYTLDVDPLTNVTAVTITENGSDQLITFPAAASTAKEIRTAIAAALKSAGYDPYYPDIYRGIAVEGTQVHVVGDLVMKSLTVDGTAEAFTALCTMQRFCKYDIGVALDTVVGAVVYNGTSGTAVVDGGDGFATGEGAAFQAAVETALDADSVPYRKVEVVEGATAFIVTIHLQGEGTIALGASSGLLAGCYPDFVA